MGSGYSWSPRARAASTCGPGLMLSVRIDGREVEMTPASLARLAFDGKVDRHSPSKTPGTTAERSLEQSLEPPYCEALSDELLCRLRSMYASESPVVDLHVLCEQVERPVPVALDEPARCRPVPLGGRMAQRRNGSSGDRRRVLRRLSPNIVSRGPPASAGLQQPRRAAHSARSARRSPGPVAGRRS